jgi:hypothetical protein
VSGLVAPSRFGSAVNDADAVVVRVRDVQVSSRVERDAARPVELRACRGCRRRPGDPQVPATVAMMPSSWTTRTQPLPVSAM